MNKHLFVEGWAVRPVVVAALAVAAAVEIIELLAGFPAMITVNWVVIPWTVLPCIAALVIVLVAHPLRRLSLKHVDRQRVIGYTALSAVGLLFASRYVKANGYDEMAAVLVAVSVEEAVYRFANPVVVMLTLSLFGVSKRVGLAVGLILSIALFAVMPGHLSQLVGLANWVALISFSLLMSYAVWRGKSLFVAILGHAIYNYANIGMQQGDITPELRFVGAAAALLALAIVAARPKTRVVDVREIPETVQSHQMVKNAH